MAALRRPLTAIGLVLALGAAMPSAGRTASAPPRIDLDGCHLALVELLDEPGRAAAFLPQGAPFSVAEFYGPGSTALSLWSFACERIAADGERGRPAQLSLLSIQVDPPGGAPWPAYAIDPGHERGNAVYYLQRFDFWLHAGYTDDARLARALRAAGLPVEHTPHMRFERRDRLADLPLARQDPLTLPATVVELRSHDDVVHASVQPNKQHPPHEHDNSWWHWSPEGGVVRMRLHLRDAIDKWCAPHSPGCADLTAAGGVAAFFGHADGGGRRDGLGIDHDRIPTGWIELRREAAAH